MLKVCLYLKIKFVFFFARNWSIQKNLHQCISQARTAYLSLSSVNPSQDVSEVVRAQAEREMKAYWKKNMNSLRPWSPHLQIYKPPMTMSMSLFHRITGCALSGAFGLSSFVTTGQFVEWVDWIRDLGVPSPVFFTAKFLLALPFVYHTLNGLRHIAWDGLLGLTVKQSNKTSMVILALAFSISFLIASIQPKI